VAELTVICAVVMAPAIWVSWVSWKTYGREDLLRHTARRCEIHDRPAPIRIKQLEAELGMGPGPTSGEIARAGYANPALIDCGHPWCRVRTSR